ncbi:MAG: hypothetical protein PHU21_02595 [Elusimicrobia bacterium]|nr:hypothetical protein [Elusimicrobiota bacterium]
MGKWKYLAAAALAGLAAKLALTVHARFERAQAARRAAPSAADELRSIGRVEAEAKSCWELNRGLVAKYRPVLNQYWRQHAELRQEAPKRFDWLLAGVDAMENRTEERLDKVVAKLEADRAADMPLERYVRLMAIARAFRQLERCWIAAGLRAGTVEEFVYAEHRAQVLGPQWSVPLSREKARYYALKIHLKELEDYARGKGIELRVPETIDCPWVPKTKDAKP